MKNFVLRSLQITVAAAALGLSGYAAAQPAAPAHAKHAHKKGHGHKAKGAHHDARAVAEGSSSSREAAAAVQADRQGQLSGGSNDQLRNNALARCAVFKVEEDKRACEARITQGQGSGSVQGGGVLREYTYTAPAK